MKNEKNYMGFHIPKVWQILKHFVGAFHWAQTSYFWRVCSVLPKWTFFPRFSALCHRWDVIKFKEESSKMHSLWSARHSCLYKVRFVLYSAVAQLKSTVYRWWQQRTTQWGLWLMKWPSEVWSFLHFSFCATTIIRGKNKVSTKWKMKKTNYMDIRILKIGQILKHFAGSFHQT